MELIKIHPGWTRSLTIKPTQKEAVKVVEIESLSHRIIESLEESGRQPIR